MHCISPVPTVPIGCKNFQDELRRAVTIQPLHSLPCSIFGSQSGNIKLQGGLSSSQNIAILLRHTCRPWVIVRKKWALPCFAYLKVSQASSIHTSRLADLHILSLTICSAHHYGLVTTDIDGFLIMFFKPKSFLSKVPWIFLIHFYLVLNCTPHITGAIYILY